MFGEDWHLALASYNGGPGRVQRAMKRSGREDFWALSASSRFLPQETRDYVPLILAAMIIARNPAQYGMNVTPWDEQQFETVQVAEAVDIRRVAEWVDIPVQTIQELNPELRRWTTPVRATDYELKVPMGTADAVRERLEQADPAELAALNRHTVKKGETLTSIAKRLKVSRGDLAEANYLTLKSRVTPGQQLVIPRPPTLLLATRTENPAPAVETRNADADVVNASNMKAPQPEKTAQSTRDPPREAGRHAVLHREAVSDDRRVAEGVEPDQRERDPDRTAADHLPERGGGDELGSVLVISTAGRPLVGPRDRGRKAVVGTTGSVDTIH